MYNLSDIEQIQDANVNLTEIRKWLYQSRKVYAKALKATECSRWKTDLQSTVGNLSCFCCDREENCIFIEIYTKLLYVLEIHKAESTFRYIVDQYKRIADDEVKLLKWLKDYERTLLDTRFDGKVSVSLDSRKNKKLTLKIDNDDFANVLEFIAIFEANYYKICDDYIDFDK